MRRADGRRRPPRAQQLARRYLRYGIRSTAALKAYLQRHEVDDALAESLVDTYVRDGILDDRAYAKLRATALAERGYAWSAIRQQLAASGLDERLIDAVVGPMAATEHDLDRARVLARARARRMPKGGSSSVRQRLARWLARRGFDADAIEHAIPLDDEQDVS